MKCRNCGVDFIDKEYPQALLCGRICGQAAFEKIEGVLKLTGKEDLDYFYNKGVKPNGCRFEKIN